MRHNLIGISGKIGSGKDTVGKMIEYYTMKHINTENKQTFEDFCRYANVKQSQNMQPDKPLPRELILGYGYWENKKFGGKLKEMVGLVLGCSEEDFEDREFKEKELGPEWWYYINNLFFNKDTILIPYMDATLEFHNNPSWYIIKLTPRIILQLMGTECGRQIIHPNIWVNALFADYKPISSTGLISGNKDNLTYPKPIMPNWIITDMRFSNEFEAIKSRGGLTIRVNLIGNENTDTHESETALDNTTFDVILNSEFGIDNLLRIVKQVMPLIL